LAGDIYFFIKILVPIRLREIANDSACATANSIWNQVLRNRCHLFAVRTMPLLCAEPALAACRT